MSLTSDQITALNFKDFYTAIRPYLCNSAHGGFTPIGTVISVMGKQAPHNYLVCDGTVYNIVDYPELAAYFTGQFEASNFFGGDGITTFAVPDLRGEFLRGAGTNSHADQGNGANVGVHQNATEESYVQIDKTNNIAFIGISNNINNTWTSANYDSVPKRSTPRTVYTLNKTVSTDSYSSDTPYTSRPTNTSVLYCIATKNIFMDAGSNYSTDEQVVGTWINGKPIYQKTIQIPVSVFSSTSGSAGYYSVGVPHNISNLGVTVNIFGQAYGNVVRPVPFSYGADNPDVLYFASLGINNSSVFIECGTKFRKSVIDTNTYGAYITVQYTKSTD